MKWQGTLVLAAALTAGVWFFNGQAQAGGCGQCFGYFGRPFSIYSTESIPYFAEFPPVYYSGPVARPYGYSPYAYPPTVLTPEPKPEPKMTINPYVRPETARQNTAQADGPQPLRIRNPYVAATPETEHLPTAAVRPPLRIVNPFVEPAADIELTQND